MLSICGGGGLVCVQPADVSLEVRLGGESFASCPIFCFFRRPKSRVGILGSSTDRLLQSCAFFRSSGVVPGRSRREARGNACAAMLRTPWPSDPAQAGR